MHSRGFLQPLKIHFCAKQFFLDFTSFVSNPDTPRHRKKKENQENFEGMKFLAEFFFIFLCKIFDVFPLLIDKSSLMVASISQNFSVYVEGKFFFKRMCNGFHQSDIKIIFFVAVS